MRRDKKDSRLSLKELSPSSKDFIRVGGRRAYLMYTNIIRTLNAYSIRYKEITKRRRVIVELPADIGYAVLVYMMLSYSTLRPGRYVGFLERMLAGKIPLVNYIGYMLKLAVDLSELKGRNTKTIVTSKAARTTSNILRTLYKYLIP